jgi:hypothetical protein
MVVNVVSYVVVFVCAEGEVSRRGTHDVQSVGYEA